MARNSFFHFKQFTIHQDQCAMKVCTDASVLGAWAPMDDADSILDIGAGTGLLSLMAAQRNPKATINAVEIDREAYLQAVANVKQSPFHDRIHVFNSAIQNFEAPCLYDMIISNPPFFQADLRSPSAKKNVAHHGMSLPFLELLDAVTRLMSPDGTFNILLPVSEAALFFKQAEQQGWQIRAKLTLFHHSNKKPFRILMALCRKQVADYIGVNADLSIYEPDGQTYHEEFKKLMKDFYFIF